MSARIGVAVMAVLLALYIVLVGQRAWLLLTSGETAGMIMGTALMKDEDPAGVLERVLGVERPP